MIGYGTESKVHLLYDIEQERVAFICDVVFNEAKIGFVESVSWDSDTEYVQLECSNEEHNGESIHEEKEQEFPQVKNFM